MTDETIGLMATVVWWIGAGVCVAGGVGIVGVISLWAADELAKAFRVHSRILKWWYEEGRKNDRD